MNCPVSTCTICKKGYANKESLEEHMRVVHVSIEVYVCTISENRYDCKEDLKEHINTEHETTYESQKVGLEVSTQNQSFPQVEHISIQF